MSTSAPTLRHPAGTPIGGQFAAGTRPAATVTLLAPRPSEREAAEADFAAAGRAEESAAQKVTTFELANLAQLALEDGHQREDVLVLVASETGGLVAVEVEPADESKEIDDLPAIWSEDLAGVTQDMYADHQLLTARWGAVGEGQRYEMAVGEALDAERELMGPDADAITGYWGRRSRAWDDYTRARTDRIVADAHMLVIDAEEAVPGARGLVLREQSDESGRILIAGLRDADGNDLASEEALDFTSYEDMPLSAISAQTLIAAGVVTQRYDDAYDMSFDVVRRLRGVADDPNQTDLFGEDTDLARFGWTGRAA